MKTLGFIGCGNMGGAIVRSLLQTGTLRPADIMISEHTAEKNARLSEELGVETTPDNAELVRNCKMVVLAMKPRYMGDVLEAVKGEITPGHIMISIAAGKDIAFMESIIGSDKKIIRTMPTTSVLVGESCSALVPNAHVTGEELQTVKSLYESFGTAEVIPENMMNAFTAVSSSPAGVFMMIEALTDGAVACGMPRAVAQKMVAQTVMGAARLACETGQHPGQLKDMVCSPAGTTIELVNTLEDQAFRSALMNAFRAASDKAGRM